MVDDPRQRQITLFTDPADGLLAANMLKDDAATPLVTHMMYEALWLPIKKMFYTKANDVVITLGKPTSEGIPDYDGGIIGYNEQVPITITAIDTSTVTAEKAIWQVEAELRRVVEIHFLGSYRSLNKIRMVPTPLPYSCAVEYLLTYEREAGDVSTHTTGITLSNGHGFLDDFTSIYLPTIFTATSDGNVGGTTIVNTAHTQGNDYWNGQQLIMLTGTCVGEICDISDFDAGTDTITLAGAGFSDKIELGDQYQISKWAMNTDGNITTISIAENSYFRIHVSVTAGNKIAYYNYYNESTTTDNLGLTQAQYPKVRWRYKTSDTSIKAKIVLVFTTWNYGLTETQNIAAGNGQIVLAESSSTTFSVGTANVTAGKTVDHIRLYANAATGYVFYDFVMLYRGDFPIPNCRYGIRKKHTNKDALLNIVSMSGDQTQGFPSGLLELEHGCDVTKGIWTRSLPADSVVGEVFHDILHNGKSEPWQWYSSPTYPSMKVRLISLEEPEMASTSQQDWRLNFTIREKRDNDAGVELYRDRWGHV